VADDDLSERLADAVADDTAIDWRLAEAAGRRTPHSDLVRRLRIVAAIGSARRAEANARQGLWPTLAVAGYLAVVVLASAKVLLAIIGAPSALTRVEPTPVTWPFAANVLLFGVAGGLLFYGGDRDRRVRSLGALFLIIASAFANPLMPRGSDGVMSLLGASLRFLSADAFLAAALWLFVWLFPSEPTQRRARRLALAFLIGASGLGLTLFTAHALRGLGVSTAASPALTTLLEALDRMPTRAYWPLLFGVALPAIPYLLWKSRSETVENRNRVALFVTVLVLGMLPILIAVIASPLVPWLTDHRWRDAIGYILYATLALVVPGTAYAVAVDRLMDLHLVIRRTTQYALARYAVWCLCLGPLALAATDIYHHRDLTITGYFGVRAVALLALSVVGFLALAFRHRIVAVVDRWFLREPADYAEALARLERRFRAIRGVREISRALHQELERAVHPAGIGVLLAHEERGELVALDGATPPLGADSALIDLFQSTRTEIQISSVDDSPVARALSSRDRDWLADTGFHLFSPLVGSTGALLGVVGLGRSRNGLPYTKRDYMLVTAMSGQAAMKIENSSLREGTADRAGAIPREREQRAIDWQNEPAALCPACATTWRPDLRVCSCGASTIPAALPLVVNGKFRVERLVGAGGIGVVYLAVDMTLDRKVAIKTLPMHPDHVARLHKEARAMAAVRHPNLALIYGAEHWRGTPLLIVEYLDGGTLLELLHQGPLDVEEAVDLGTALADALDRVHASGLLHRDVKPSNIGYTADGLPKLLDFGLATILDRSKGSSAQPVKLEPGQLPELDWAAQPSVSMTLTQQLVGTPLYLSPEALAGSTPEPSFDLWSLSLVLYEALAGRHPLGGESVADVVRRTRHDPIPDVRDLRSDCPAAVAAFLNDALSRVPSRRPATAAELRTRLRELRATMGPSRY
jgi:hypothetical protein